MLLTVGPGPISTTSLAGDRGQRMSKKTDQTVFCVVNGREVYAAGEVKKWRCPICRWWLDWQTGKCPACGTLRDGDGQSLRDGGGDDSP